MKIIMVSIASVSLLYCLIETYKAHKQQDEDLASLGASLSAVMFLLLMMCIFIRYPS